MRSERGGNAMQQDRNADKEAGLGRMQRVALACVGAAAAVFVATLFLPPTFWVRLARAGAEAAMVGGLADWFAVVALFRRPLGLPIPHTAVIPKSKERIAANLAAFIRDKFLNPEVVTDLVRRSDPAQWLAAWFSEPANARRIGRHSAELMGVLLDLVDDRRIQAFLNDAARTVIGRIDFSQAVGAVLEMLTRGGSHQQLLDAVLRHAIGLLRRPETQQLIAQRVVSWLKSEHKWKQIVLPTEWLGDKAAEAARGNVIDFLDEVARMPAHELRAAFDDALEGLIARLRTDEAFVRKGEEIKDFVLRNPQLADYAQNVWAALRDWLSNDLASSSPQLQQQVERVGLWFGRRLSEDRELRRSINDHAESFAAAAAPRFADFLTSHISDTVRNWDATDMSRQIELSIGPDLQYIRISGTAVGCCIGILLFLVSHVGEML